MCREKVGPKLWTNPRDLKILSLKMGNGERVRDDGRNTPSLLRNGFLNVGGQVARGAVVVLAIPFLIRLLGIAEYGVWSFAYAFLALVTMCEAGFSVAAAVFLSKDLANDNVVAAGHTLTFIILSALLLSSALALVLWFAGPLIARLLTSFAPAERSAAGHAMQIAGIAAAILIFQRTLVGIEQAFDRYAVINALDLVQTLLTNLGFMAVAAWGGRTVGLMKWQITASVLVLLAHIYVVRSFSRAHRLAFGWNINKAQEIFRYSIATWTATLGSAAFSQCDRLIVGAVLGPSLLGIYSAITNITSKINTVSATAVQPLVPSLSRDVAVSAPSQHRMRLSTRLNALIAIGAGMCIYLLADLFLRVLGTGDGGGQYVQALQIAAVIYALYSLSAPGYFVLFSRGGVPTIALATLSSGLFSLLLIFTGARYLGLLGAIVGNAGYLGTLAMIVAASRKTGIALSRFFNWIAFPLVCFCVALAVGWILRAHLTWRAAVVVAETLLFSIWFFYGRAKETRMDFAGAPSVSDLNPYTVHALGDPALPNPWTSE